MPLAENAEDSYNLSSQSILPSYSGSWSILKETDVDHAHSVRADMSPVHQRRNKSANQVITGCQKLEAVETYLSAN